MTLYLELNKNKNLLVILFIIYIKYRLNIEQFLKSHK